ncbi:hypothetical protein Tco_0357963, partial [Tanacetum coccineum]
MQEVSGSSLSMGSFPSRWESVGFCPIDASIRGWQGQPSRYVMWNRITNYYPRLAGTVTPPKLGRSGICFRERYFMIPLH